MRFDYKALREFDFVHLVSGSWGSVDCIVIRNKRGSLEFLMTEPYEKSFDYNFEFFTVEDSYKDLNGYYHKELDDIFLLLGKTDPRLISMQYRMIDNE